MHPRTRHSFRFVKRNYKVQANIGFNGRSTRRFTTALNTSSGPRFIPSKLLPGPTWNRIQPGAPGNVIFDANNRLFNVSGFVDLFVDTGGRSTLVVFNVTEHLAASVIINCEYCDQYTESISSRKPLVELDDGTMVQIITRPNRRASTTVPPPRQRE